MARKKQGRRLRIRHILILAVILYIGSIFINQQKIINELNAERKEKVQEINALENNIKNLEDKIQYSDSLEYIEKIAREELNMVMPDEIIYIDKGMSSDEANKGINE